jgi:hypothetical protein
VSLRGLSEPARAAVAAARELFEAGELDPLDVPDKVIVIAYAIAEQERCKCGACTWLRLYFTELERLKARGEG